MTWRQLGARMRELWQKCCAGYRPRSPLRSWNRDLTLPHERAQIERRNREAVADLNRLRHEVELIQQDHARER